jgi:putative membrane protein
MSIDMMPTLNAILNASSGLLITIGYVFIRQRKISAHRACMIGALTCSSLFLISYVTYHVGFGKGVTRFTGTGFVRWFYLSVLTSHTILAVVIVPFVILTFRRAFRGDFARHRAVARWTFPMWLYVSVTGVMVYFMLYHLYPSRPN